jgi:hypothetical protein
MQIYLKNIRVVNPTQALDGIYNILINEGKIDYFGFSEINVSPE